MIRFVKMTVFSEIQRLFSIRKPADSTVKVHTIRFVCFPFVFGSRGGWRDAVGAITNAKVQMPNQAQNPNAKEK
jgi:hypothetical protein